MGLSKGAAALALDQSVQGDAGGDAMSVAPSEEEDPRGMEGGTTDNGSSYGDEGPTNNKNNNNTNSGEEAIAQKETKLVRHLRFLTFLVLFLMAVTACVAVYLYSTGDEQRAFESDFEGQGAKLISSFQDDAYKKCQALASLSSELTRHAVDKNMAWPFVTVYKSSYLLDPYLSIGDFAALNIYPIVPKQLRELWEIYSVEFQWWIDDDLQARNDYSRVNHECSTNKTNGFDTDTNTDTDMHSCARRKLQAFHEYHSGTPTAHAHRQLSKGSISPYIKVSDSCCAGSKGISEVTGQICQSTF
jgi:hypothetical protein